MSSSFSTRRIASVPAWSTKSESPLPATRLAAIAACSVTRTVSSTSARSMSIAAPRFAEKGFPLVVACLGVLFVAVIGPIVTQPPSGTHVVPLKAPTVNFLVAKNLLPPVVKYRYGDLYPKNKH